MARIEVSTQIDAPAEICFDLARDIGFHTRSMSTTGEQAIAGKTSGLIELGEQVTWQARHFQMLHRHTARMTVFDRPHHFRDEMIEGRFRSFVHDHYFKPIRSGGTRMIDVIEFRSPLRPIGWLVDTLFLKRYLRRLITQRSMDIRAHAQSKGNSTPSEP